MTTDARRDAIEHSIGRQGLLVLRVHDGDVHVRGVAGDMARVRSMDREPLDRLAIDRGEGSLSIQAPDGQGVTADLSVEVPEAATVVLDAASSDITIEHLIGEQRIRTASGDLRIRDVEGTLTAEAVSGDIDIRAKGPLAAVARTVSGDLELEAPVLRTLQAMTTSGDITIDAGFQGDGPFSIETVSGDTSLAAAGAFRIEATTLTGDIQGARERAGRDQGPIVLGSEHGPTIVFRSTSGDLGVDARPARVGTAAQATALAPAPAAATRPDADTQPAALEAGPPDDGPSDTLEVLRALERGDIDLDEARRRLAVADGTEAGGVHLDA